MTYVLSFDHLSKDDIPVAGGKGANLGELSAAGFIVPSGFVLTTAAYELFIRDNELQAPIIEMASQASVDDPRSSERASSAIQNLFVAAEMPEDIRVALLAAHMTLTDDEATPLAVRSSATAEDLPSASFAGQQDTYLNIRGANALLDAVKRCWASLWTARAIAYRLRQGIDPASVSLAVIVQHFIPADAAGILFTANPVNGQRDQILINATWGLGEAIVGGIVTPDTVVVDKSTYEILTRETAVKTIMTIRAEDGTEQQIVSLAKQEQPVLDDVTAVRLARIGGEIEVHYGMPMDIEWAIAGEESSNKDIAILQARPITSLPDEKAAPLPDVVWEPIMPDTIWMRRQIVEHMPEPLSPLFEDLYLKQGLVQSMTELMGVMGELGGVELDLDELIPYGFARTINGYAYTTGSYVMSAKNTWAILRIYTRILRLLKLPDFDWDGVVLPRYQALIQRWDAVVLSEAADSELLRGISEMAAEDSRYWFGSAGSLALSRLMDSVFDRLLRSPLFRYALPQPQPVSATFLRGFDSKALDAQAELEALANTIRASAPLRDLVLDTAARQLIETVTSHPAGQPIVAGIQHYLNQYGHQIYNLDFVDPTQNEDPLPMLLSLKALVQNPPKQDVRTRQAEMAAERDALIDEIMQRLNPLSRRLFRWVWRWTKHYAPYREYVMFYMGAAWPTTRRLAHELGQRLVDAGVISEPDDIYYLESSEIIAVHEASANESTMPDYVQMVQDRRALRQARMLLTPPAKVPERSTLKVGPIDLSMFDPTPGDADNEGPILNGYAVSTGRVTAQASVIRTIDDFDRMQPGTILVCTTTTPAWTPLFSQAVGLVTDVGGALAHGSIVAREYGIPAVMGTGVATERIESGQMLIVDGDAGTVTLVDAEETHPATQSATHRQSTSNVQKRALWALGVTALLGFVLWRRRR